MDKHWDKASLQGLYAFESPQAGSGRGVHRLGMSVKADVEIGLAADALYALNAGAGAGIEGLSFSLGGDYSLWGGKLIVLAEYLYSGGRSSTALGYGGSLSNRNYLYSGMRFIISDYTSAGLALISGFDDVSFTPILSLEHDLFQGMTLSLSAKIPLDRDLFSSGGRGELGPVPPDELQGALPASGKRTGSYGVFNAKVRLRF